MSRDSNVVVAGLTPPEKSADEISAEEFIATHGMVKIMTFLPNNQIHAAVKDVMTLSDVKNRLRRWGWTRLRQRPTKEEENFEIMVCTYNRKGLLPIRDWMLRV